LDVRSQGKGSLRDGGFSAIRLITRPDIEAAVDGLLIACLYLPNGNSQPGPKFDHKMIWLSRLARHAVQWQKQSHPALLVGDYNVAPIDLDIYTPKSWAKDALVQPAPRKAFASLVANGWTDALRDIFGDLHLLDLPATSP
jgi:exodeoxyribonuclease-3